MYSKFRLMHGNRIRNSYVCEAVLAKSIEYLHRVMCVNA